MKRRPKWTDRRFRAGAIVGLLAVMVGVGAAPAAAAQPSGKVGAGARVDLGKPTFSNPTRITNPLFPKDRRTQVIQLGAEGGDTLRFEVTQLRRTKVVRWDGRNVRTVVTHFMAYTNGRLVEVALDYYAQADDGAVWYFGEDVDNYENGVIADHDGTWLAGRDGPPGMIMPARPRVGDVFRPENIPGFVFEEVTVKAVGLTVAGPRGPVRGAILTRARLLDGTVEEKIFAPGYGEFRAEVKSLDELYRLALAVPADALHGRVPRQLSVLSAGATAVAKSVTCGQWRRISALVDRMRTAWRSYSGRDVPALLDKQLTGALAALRTTVAARNPAAAGQAALDVGQASLDLELRYRSRVAVDRARLDLWRLRLRLDRAAGDPALVAGDRATIRAIRDRIRG